MAQLDLYVDTYSRTLVTGPANPAPFALPAWYQGDTVSLRVYLLERTTTYPLAIPYSVTNNANLSLKVALGPKDGTAGSTLYTQQFTWGKSADNLYFFADFPLNTAAINTLLGSSPTASAWFEIEYTQNGYPTTVYQAQATIHAEVIETGVITVPPGDTGATVAYVNATFLQNQNNGFILANPNTGGRVFVYLHDDGTVHFDPLP